MGGGRAGSFIAILCQMVPVMSLVKIIFFERVEKEVNYGSAEIVETTFVFPTLHRIHVVFGYFFLYLLCRIFLGRYLMIIPFFNLSFIFVYYMC